MTRIEAVIDMLKNERVQTNQIIAEMQEREKYLYSLINKVEKIQSDRHLKDKEPQP
jgi:hypothetical protein